MAKIIKKIIRYLLILSAVMVLVPSMAFILLQAPRIQTFVTRQVTGTISRKLDAEIRIDKVSYRFFRKINLYDIYIGDHSGDTLLTAREISLRIKAFNPSEKTFHFGRTDVFEADFRMVKDSSGVLNLTKYLNALKKDEKPDSTGKVDLSFADIVLYDASYTLADPYDTLEKNTDGIDFTNLRITSLAGRINDLSITNDSVSMNLDNIAFTESSGFYALNFKSMVTVVNSSLYFRDIRLRTDSSSVDADRIYLLPGDSSSWGDFINKVRLDVSLNRSVLSIKDLAYFVPQFNGMNEVLTLSGRINGTVSSMKGRKVEIEYSDSTRLLFDFDVAGLPDINQSYLYTNFTNLQVLPGDLEKFSLPGGKGIKLPPVVHDLGLIRFAGSFTGFTTDFVTLGKLTTERGSFTGDLSLRPEGKNTFRFKGLLKAENVDLGYVARDSALLGGLWFHTDIDGSMKSFSHISANISGKIDSVEVNSYMYRNISLEGTYSNRIWDGNVSVKDDNIRMDILGRFDLAESLPEFDFTMNLAHADLHELNLVSSDSLFNVSALMTATFRGNNIDNLDGVLRLINSTMQNSNGSISIYDFMISSGARQGIPLLTLKSDFADAEVRGAHTFAALGNSARKLLAAMFPSRFLPPPPLPGNTAIPNNFTYEAKVKKLDKLNEFFGSGLRIAEGSLISGHFLAKSSDFSARFTSDAVTLAGTRFAKLVLDGAIINNRLNLKFTSDTLVLPDNSELDNLQLLSTSRPDTLDLDILWDNKDEGKTRGEVKALGLFSSGDNNRSLITVSLLPGSFTINHVPWTISPARIAVDSSMARFDNILLSSRQSYIRLDGILSHNPSDKLTLSFDGLNLNYLNNLGNDDGTDDNNATMSFSGLMQGYVSLSDVYKNFLFESNIDIADFILDGDRYGAVTVRSEWNPEQKIAEINISDNFEGNKYFDITGTYNPALKSLRLTASTFRMPLDVIRPFVKSFASDVRGVGTGKIFLERKNREISLKGSIMAEDASLKVDFLQTRYFFSDSIRFTPRSIDFRNIRVYDEKKNQGTVNGRITHHSFKDFGISLDFNINNMLVLNTKPKDNEIFYGTAYATGYAGIRGDGDKLSFNISAKTENNTEFYVPLNSSASVSDYPYIVFTSNKEKTTVADKAKELFTPQETTSGIELNFDLEVTPAAEVQLIMDSKAGDVIRGTGSGKLNISLNSKGDLKMAGDYVIEDGDYLFTLGNILNKRFSVEEGGTISWNGNIEDAELNLKAIYRTKASLYELFNDEAFKERIPVECQLNLTEKLLNPVIGFNIYLPTADEETREYLRLAINSEEELSRQFLYLLVMNSFYPDPALFSSSPQAQTQGASAIGVTTTEMLSNQLSNWLSQISNDFDIGFNYRPGNEITPQEMDVALSTQLLEDKVILNGNFDVGGKQLNKQASNISGDFDIEFKITEELRFKVFNRSNNNIFYETAPYTQGFGFFFRRNFDKLKELFVLPDKRKKKVNGTKEEADSQ